MEPVQKLTKHLSKGNKSAKLSQDTPVLLSDTVT